jgi:hypothetical protein
MRGEFAAVAEAGSLQGLTGDDYPAQISHRGHHRGHHHNDKQIAARSQHLSMSMAHKAKKLKLSGHLSREIPERRQVGDAEQMIHRDAWWRNVGMEECM